MKITAISRSAIAGCLVALLTLFTLMPASAAADDLGRAKCLSCHDTKATAIKVAGADGAAKLNAIDPDHYAKSVHAKMECVACHQDITDATAHHAKASGTKVLECSACHEQLAGKLKAEGKPLTPGLEQVAKNTLAYRGSFHSRPNKEDKSHPNASCNQCHDTHAFAVPAKGTPERDAWRLETPALCGEACHEDELSDYRKSIHGKEAMGKHNLKAAVCIDCHSSHDIGNTSADTTQLAITSNCGSCHKENFESYIKTYHGQINQLGYAYTAKCFDCHGSHKITKVDDPRSKVNPANRMKTCETCHNGKKDLAQAPAGFATFQPHGHAGDFEHYPQIWVAWQIMVQLLVGTFGFFWLHTLLWFYREYKERKQHGEEARISAAALPANLRGKYVRRFSPVWRLAHISFALSLMILTLTGIPLLYPNAPWASTLMAGLGGPHVARIIHRVNAVIFAGVFFWHLFYIAWRIARTWKTFRFFGPDSMIPNLQDMKDIWSMFKWFFGRGPRPQFDRWTYWEKFDYWAPFWGVTIIGVSGLIMWLPNVFGAFLPGWVFNVAAIFHGEEAFLAVVFLFTVHFFNNHFRPDKFPLEVVMFTGSFAIDKFKHEHALEYERLVASGELEKYLVDPPSATKLAASRVLGFVLIALGLTLLTLVAIGFFSG